MEWDGRLSNTEIQEVLLLGVKMQDTPMEERPMRLVLWATDLYGRKVARSYEEGYIMIMEAYAHAEVMNILNWYERTLLRISISPTDVQNSNQKETRLNP